MALLLSTLDDSIEAKIIRAFFELLRADTQIGEGAVDAQGNPCGFPKWRLVEMPEDLGLQQFDTWTAVVYPMMITPDDMPSHREVSFVHCAVSFYVPWEPGTESSRLLWIRLFNRLRKIVASTGILSDPDAPHDHLADKTEQVVPLKPTVLQAARILPFRVTYQTDIDTPTGAAA